MGTDSNARCLGWQQDAYRELGKFLAAAVKQDLPAVTWTIAISGALVVDVDALAPTPEQQRAAFDAWARHLSAEVAPERVDSDGVVHLYAMFIVTDGKVTDGFDVAGAIRATIYPPLDDEAGA